LGRQRDDRAGQARRGATSRPGPPVAGHWASGGPGRDAARTLDLPARGRWRRERRPGRRPARMVGAASGKAGGFRKIEDRGAGRRADRLSTWDAPMITARVAEGRAAARSVRSASNPLGALGANTRREPAMELRRGNAGSNTAGDHKERAGRELAQVTAPYSGNVIVRDGRRRSHPGVAST